MQTRLRDALDRAFYYVQMIDVVRSEKEKEWAEIMYRNEMSKVNLLKHLLGENK